MNLLQPLNIDFSGINLVEASAGTGKTYNITSLYIRALIEQEQPVGKILVVTYTEAATKELKDRLLQRIRESARTLRAGKVEKEGHDEFLEQLLKEVSDRDQAVVRLERAVRNFDEAAVYTIHGFCYQALQEQAFESRAMYDAEMIGDDSELVQEAVDDYWRRWVAEVSDHPQKRPLLQLLIDNNTGPESLARELGSYISKPYLKVLPEKVLPVSDFQNKLDELETIFNKMQAVWRQQNDKILALLLSDGLNGRKYRRDYLSNWFSFMDEFLGSGFSSIKPFQQFENFTRSVLSKNLNSGYDQPPGHPFFELADEYAEKLNLILKFEIAFKKDLLEYLRGELNQKKEELQVLSYDDLLLRLRNALLNPDRGEQLARKLRQKYPVAMVDEFQDTDPNQYDIFRTIYKDAGGTLFMIGDPKQSIYSFRGADVHSYIKAREDAHRGNRYRLDRNFRSTPGLLRGLNAFWGGHENPFVMGDDIQYQEVDWGKPKEQYKRLKEYGKERPPIRFRRLSERGQDQRTKEEAAQIAATDTAGEIDRLLKGGKKGDITIGDKKVRAKDIAVLVRSHTQADLISETLQEHGIKSVRHSEESVFKSEEAKQLQQLLQAVAEPGSETRVKTALSLPLNGYTAAELFSIEENETKWTAVLRDFFDWHRIWQERGFSAMYRSLLGGLEVAKHVVSYPDGERRLTNLLHLGELLQKESRRKEGTRSLLHWLARKCRDNGSKNDEEQLRLESDEALVKVVTMHKSKGLQYPIVFCPFLWYGPRISDSGQPLVYHHPDDKETTYLDLSGKSDPGRAEKRFFALQEELAESLRLAYVAMTRAEYGLYLSWDLAKASQFSALGYLLQDPEQAQALLKSKVNSGEKVDWSGDEMHEAMDALCREHPRLFTLEKQPSKPENGQLAFPGMAGEESPELRVRSFERATPLENSYRVSSFSSLSSWMEEDDPDIPDYDQFSEQDEGAAGGLKPDDERSIFSFPKGPQPGTCIHNIFEELDFARAGQSTALIDRKLSDSGIGIQWSPVVARMLGTVLNKPLLEGNEALRLSAVPVENQLAEMEFYYPSSGISSQKLLSIIREEESELQRTGGFAAAGFLKGFIDLTFRFGGKYYILDYKTNYLGDTAADYGAGELRREMHASSYDLQYHIYVVALHRFLSDKIPGYSYEKHFGGAFYLFIRGMNEKGSEGIFFDRPAKRTIDKLNRYIKEGRHE